MRKTKSAILEAVHEIAQELHQAGVMNKTTMREFDSLCLPPITKRQTDEIKQVREAVKPYLLLFSIPVFIRFRNGNPVINKPLDYCAQTFAYGEKKGCCSAYKCVGYRMQLT